MSNDVRDAKILTAAIKYADKKIAELVEDIQPQIIEGPPGPAGPAGPSGARGERGETGPERKIVIEAKGPVGPQGVPGHTIEKAFLDDGKLQLIREDGEIFNVGKVVGPRGGQGVPGKQGIQGEIGSQGLQGLIGEQGPQGLTGRQGRPGEKGDQGEQGPRGFLGEQGSPGPQGLQGERGDKGDRGDTGIQGVQGPQGPQGPQGDQGEQGEPGVDGKQVDIQPQLDVFEKGVEKRIVAFSAEINSRMDKISMKSPVHAGGGGEVRLEFLDDVDRATAKVNGKFLKYDSSSKKFVGADAGSGLTVKEEGSNVGTAVDTIDFVGATVTASGNTTTIQVQSAAVGNNISTTLQTQHIIPASNNTFDLGSTTKRFRDLYLQGSTINLGATTISANSLGTFTDTEQVASRQWTRGWGIANGVIASTYSTNNYVNVLLSNTNSFIATKLNSSSYTAADVQSKAALANTNSAIAAKTTLAAATAAAADDALAFAIALG
jgi:hypothetical protein